MQKTIQGLLAAIALCVAASGSAAEFYVGPNASASGDGSIGNPWKLQTALDQPSAVHPGDTIWVRGGTYVGHFTSHLNGTSASPIIVRAYTGERAKVDGHLDATNDPAIDVMGSYTWFWGLEVMNSGTNRTTSGTGNIPPPGKGPGFYVGAPGAKIINCIVHDNSEGLDIWEAATGAEVTGTLSYFNGWDDVQTRGSGHGIYTQNQTGTKHFYDNLLFDGFSYGIHAYAEGGHLDNLDFEGNISFNNGSLSQVSGYAANLLLGGLTIAHNPTLIDNYTYFPSGGKWTNLGYSAGCQNAVVHGNHFAAGNAFALINCTSVTMTGNTFYGLTSGFTHSQYPNNSYYATPPAGTEVFVRPNSYEPGRAHIAVYNWDQTDTVSVDLSSVMSTGSAYEIRSAQDYWGTPAVAGTYDGNPVSIPMSGLPVMTPVGWSAPPASGPEFNAFVLTSTLGPNSFFDVPDSNPFHDAVSALSASGVTAGCGLGLYCPDAAVTRAQMAIFLLKAEHGASYQPPSATGTVFSDVHTSTFGAAWIERLKAESITGGCGGGKYCPGAAVTRAQMAVFLLKASVSPTYAPPAATGTVFSDVSRTSFAAAWIEDLQRRGLTSGCGGGKFCPGAISTRGQMAAFLVSAFSLP